MVIDPGGQCAETTCRLGWQHIRLDVPVSWEIVAYKKDRATGQLVLSNRRGVTMQIFWKKIKREVSLTRGLVSLARANMKEPPAESKLRRMIRKFHGWRVFFPASEETPVFAARLLDDGNTIINVTFPPHPDTADGELVRQVLASWRPNDGKVRLWAAFGIEVELPEDMELLEAESLPTMQRMSFENRKNHTVTVYRFCMMPAILGEEDMATFIAGVKGRKRALHVTDTFRKDERHEGVKLVYVTRGSRVFGGVFDRFWRGCIYAWRRDDIQRMIAIENHAPEKFLLENIVERATCR